MFFATSRQLAELPSRRRVPVSLNRELLEAPNLVLVPHEAEGSTGGSSAAEEP